MEKLSLFSVRLTDYKEVETEEAEVHFALDHLNESHSKEIARLIDHLPQICVDDEEGRDAAREWSLERCIYILDSYQEQPHLLDVAIPSFVDRLINYIRTSFTESNRRLFYQSSHFLRQLIKVRGYKSFGRFLPHDTVDVIPVLCMLEEQRRLNPTAEPTDVSIAEYVLLIWMSMLCRIPFDFAKFDHGSGDSVDSKVSTSQRIYDAVSTCLLAHDQRREAAAYCLSIFVVRPDSMARYLRPLLFDDILGLLGGAHEDPSQLLEKYGSNLEHVISARCLLLANILKRIKREEIPQDWAKTILDKIFAYSSILDHSKNIHIRKLTTKIVVRTALTMLKPRIASWRYDRGSRSLAITLPGSDGDSQGATADVMKNGDRDDDQFTVGEEIEPVINYLLFAAKDKDTICRWSAAKGFGRVCSRLPRELADQVVSALLSFFEDEFEDASRHGACLALAELGRRGLLLPSRLPEVVPLVIRCLTYDEQRGTYSVGSNVRDAACYVCWSFARAYAPSELRPYNLQLATGLLVIAVYDREVNCRRAASAAFQEHVGRQKGEFPHGIELLTTVDYFEVGNRKKCYRELSRFVAKFPEYARPMIDHVADRKINHWDQDIRRLAGDALGGLSSIDPDFMVSNIVPRLIQIAQGSELFPCQGALFALGSTSSVLRQRLSRSTIKEILDIPSRLSTSHVFKDAGGELIKNALNDFIGNICSYLGTAVTGEEDIMEYAGIFQSILDENLVQQKDESRYGAQRALESLFTAAPMVVTRSLIEDYAGRLERASYERQRSGASFALSSLPRQAIIEHRATILDVLTRFGVISMNKSSPDSSWALARRDTLWALAAVITKLGLDAEDGLTADETNSVLECYVKSMDDFTIDSRGDIGSLVREAAVSGTKDLYSQHINCKRHLNVDEDLFGRALGKLLQQCCEKIDRTRILACRSMESIVREASRDRQSVGNLHIPRLQSVGNLHIPRLDLLVDVFLSTQVEWIEPDQAYPKLVQLLNAGPVFAYPVLLGFAVAVGGLTESTVRSSTDAILSYMAGIKDDQEALRLVIRVLISIFSDHRKVDRVSISLMKMVDVIFSSNYLDDFLVTDDDTTAMGRLLDLCIMETKLSKNSQKVLTGLSVCCGFLRYESSEVAMKALKYGLAMLVHPYPRVRREAASQLYESILSYFPLDNHSELALGVLSETDWDAEPDDLKDCTRQLRQLLKVD